MATTPKKDFLQNDYATQEILQKILTTLEDSNITEKGNKDTYNRFWASYNQAATEYDGEFLERNSSDMDIVLLSSGLFAAINTAFIVAMQPNTTTPLLWQLVQNTSSNTTISPLAASAANPPNTIWFQTFAYAALSLDLLAAFGAVLGKQWLSHYKSTARGKDRQEKLDGLEAWHFHAVLLSFLMLLQISFFIFGIALSAFVWNQQGATAIAVIVVMAFGLFFCLFIIVASLKFPQCPFQTFISAFLRFIGGHLPAQVTAGWKGSKEMCSSHDPRELKESREIASAVRSMRWIFNTSTNPEVISSAAWLLPTIRWAPKVNMTAACLQLQSTFAACFHDNALLSNSARRRALACGRALHYLVCNKTIETIISSDLMRFDDWTDWRHLSLPWGLERCKEFFSPVCHHFR
ncbi:uncharacterized protein F5147DRAFT_256990 [Suillus discolor]|uniref:DUF6535 domain-containing protein n=1 Tax=Suillus discolor TaxID=1912936 RepID=A0A9P7K022_9AGAM|nr:uncharacterized protein F5147DRAFT_256990 [Suillus discolor]KAG2118086.1 hypothetical protein F5147DRAFT_256990 [Suillus discolor]